MGAASWLVGLVLTLAAVGLAWWLIGVVDRSWSRRSRPCPTCKGHGNLPDAEFPRFHPCPACGGTGTTATRRA